jgi:superfamily II DNA or RNA helicase
MKIVVGNLTSTLETDNPKIISALRDKYAFSVPGHEYSQAYRRRRWDGKKRYFGANGKFRTGLLRRILRDLDEIGATDIEWENRTEEKEPFIPSVGNFEYREYQEQAIYQCLKKRRAIVDSPTGSGKTLIMAGCIAALQHGQDITAVVLFREKGILNQTYEFFKKCGIRDLGYNSGEGYVPGKIMLSTVQSIERIIDTHLQDTELLMVDEAHQFCRGETTIAAVESFPNAPYRLAFTATPPRENAKDINARMVLEGAFGPVYTTRTAEDLIKDGALAKPIIQIVDNTNITVEEAVEDGLSYLDMYDRCVVNCDQRNDKVKTIVSKIYQSNPNAKILILVKNLQHIENLEKRISNCYTIEGKDDIDSRYDIINKFVKDDKAATIIGTNVMQTGISIDEITHMINARGLSGEVPTLQGLGRGIRKAKGKDTMYFYDFYDRAPYLENHSKQRIRHYKRLKFEVNNVRF